MKAKPVLERGHRTRRILTSSAPNQGPVGLPTISAGSRQELFEVPCRGNVDDFGPETAPGSTIMPAAYNWFRSYDWKGNVIEEGLYWGESLLVFRWIYMYNDKGNKIEAKLYNAQHSLRVRCLYNEEETLVKRLIYRNGCCDEEIDYEYEGATKFLGSLVQRADGSTSHSAHLRI